MGNKRMVMLIGVIAIGIVLMVAAIGFLIIQRKNKTSVPQVIPTSAISGSFNINGVIPEDASIRILKKPYGSTQNMELAQDNISLQDQGSWSVAGLTTGSSYELVAEILMNGKVHTTSAPVFVTAPATNESFVFNLTQVASIEPALISGTVQINGYLPQNSSFTILGRKLGDSVFEILVPYSKATNTNTFSYSNSLSGTTYELLTLLYDGFYNQIGQSSVISVSAPASNEAFTINSNALAPLVAPTPIPTTPGPSQSPGSPTPTTISGTINFNGNALYNSRIVILQKVYNTSTYAVAVDNLPAIDGTSWTWTNPTPSTWYDLIAVLKQKQSNGTDRDIAVSAVKSVAAPATNTVLTLNSSILLPGPTGDIKVVCMDQVAGIWNAQVVYASVENAKRYWLQVGTKSGDSDIANVTQNSSGTSEQRINVQLKKQTPFYARYAYSLVENVATSSSQFSPFSTTTQIQCN